MLIEEYRLKEDEDMFLPKVKVELINPEDNIRFIGNWLAKDTQKNKTRPFYEKTITLYPELRDIDQVSDAAERKAMIRRAVTSRLDENREVIEKRMAYFSERFDSFLYEFIGACCRLFNYEWKAEHPFITCYTGYLPFYPRSTTEMCFYVSYHDEERVFSGAVHEINHMIFFQKWNETHGGGIKEPAWPDPLWYLEEIIVDPTLNEENVRKHTLYENKAYPLFYEPDETGESVMDRIRKLFDSRTSIEDFLEKAYAAVCLEYKG